MEDAAEVLRELFRAAAVDPHSAAIPQGDFTSAVYVGFFEAADQSARLYLLRHEMSEEDVRALVQAAAEHNLMIVVTVFPAAIGVSLPEARFLQKPIVLPYEKLREEIVCHSDMTATVVYPSWAGNVRAPDVRQSLVNPPPHTP